MYIHMYFFSYLCLYRCIDIKSSLYLNGFAHLWYWRKGYFSEIPNWLLCCPSSWCYSLVYLGKIGTLCQNEDSCSARREDYPCLPEQRAHGCPPTNISAALENHTKTAHANPAEALLFSSPAHLQPSSGAGWSPVCSWQEPQHGKFLYQVCQASQAFTSEFELTRKLAKDSRQMYCLQLLRHYQRSTAWHLCP